MEKCFYTFNYNFDYKKLLRHANIIINEGLLDWKGRDRDKKVITTHDQAKKSWLGKYRLSYSTHPSAKIIYQELGRFLYDIGSSGLAANILLVKYDDKSFIDWHIDDETKDWGRINMVLTPSVPSPMRFKVNDNREEWHAAKLSATNEYNIEHCYTNIGKEERISIWITTTDLFYDELLMRIKEQEFKKNESFL